MASRLVLATRNAKKVVELRASSAGGLADAAVDGGVADVPPSSEPPRPG